MKVAIALIATLAAQTWVARPDELTLKELKSARKIYVAKCAKCHQFYEPRKYQEIDWQKWMKSMSKKSKLKPPQEELLTRYLDEYRAGRIEQAK